MVFPIAGGNESKGYEISNSLRFNDGDSAKLGLAFGSGGNTKTWTVSCWFKRGIISSRQSFLNVGSSGSEYMSLYIDSDDKLYWVTESGGNTYRIGSSALFRDPSAWYHIVFRQDTTDGTANNRFRYYINGAEVDTGAFNAQPTQNFDGKIGGNDTHYIGSNRDGDGEFMDGYLTEYHYLDGISYDPTYFGEFDDNGVWIPKKYTGSYGTKGFFLEFKQTGTSANSSGIGADTSGNDNHWTPTNLAATDITEDTCTNNFATMNPLAAFENDGTTYFNGNYTMAEGNLQMVSSGNVGNWGHSFSTIGVSSGKWYWENRVNSISNSTHSGVSELFTSGYFQNQSTSKNINLINGNSNSGNYNIGSSFSSGDILIVALDMDNGEVYFGKNGTWGNSGNPATNTNPCFTGLDTTTEYFAGFDIAYTGSFSWNFGNPDFSISSGNNDGKYGNFEYAPPSGYYALCTKRLAEFG